MHVVAAGVHDWSLDPGIVALGCFAGIWKASLLEDGQSIHVGAEEDFSPRAVLEDGG